MRRLAWLFLAMALAVSAPAAAAAPQGVQVTVTRAEYGDWIVEFDFRRRAQIWFFPRSYQDLGGKPWRQQSWIVETPGVRLERVGHYDVLAADGAPLQRVRIRMRPFVQPLIADYTPALRFSDGGLALYTGHFLLAPLASRAAVEALPADVNGVKLDEPPVTLTVNDPGRRLLVKGRTRNGTASLRLYDGDTYVYAGDAPVIETEAFAGVIDAGLPAWVRTELEDFTPRLMRLYTERLGKPAGGRPMALVAWQGAELDGSSLGGSVLPGMVAMRIEGSRVARLAPGILADLRWFIGHESAHFWMGQTVRYTRRSESWISEGAADVLAIRALEQLAPGYDARGELQRSLDDCIALNGSGEPLGTAEERGEHRAHYACGAMLLLAAEAATRRASPGADAFTFVRGLIDANRRDGQVNADDWLAAFGRSARDATLAGEVRTFLEKGVADPRGFWIRLFTATGVGFRMEGEGLRLS